MKKLHILVDFDYVLCLPEQHTEAGVVARYKEYEAIWTEESFLEALCGRLTLEETIQNHFLLPWKGMNLQDIIKDMIALGTNIHGINRDLVRVLEHLASQGHVICLATDQVSFRLSYLRRHLPSLFEIFDHQFASCEIGAVKAKKQFFLYVLNGLGVNPNDCLFIDDRDENVECARTLGIPSIRYAKERHKAFERWLYQEVYAVHT